MADSIRPPQQHHQQQHQHQVHIQELGPLISSPTHKQQQQNQNNPSSAYGMIQGIPSSCPPNLLAANSAVDYFKENQAGAYDLGELDQALFFYLEGDTASALQKPCSSGSRRPTLNIFPSKPMHIEASTPQALSRATSASGAESFDSESAQQQTTTISFKRNSHLQQQQQHKTGEFESSSSNNNNNAVSRKTEPMQGSDMGGRSLANPAPAPATEKQLIELDKDAKHDAKKGPASSSEPEGAKTPDAKTLRRLAQNREAARKSRLRKKAYVQQLESSRIKLAQLEQELQRARQQGIFIGGGFLGEQQGHVAGNAVAANGTLSSAAAFEMEYQRWLEDHHRHTCDLRAAIQEHLGDNDLRVFLANCVAHHEELYHIKSIAIKSDVFYLVSGMWKTPAERCFMWMGGFRPSDLLKVLIPQIEPLTEQQYQFVCNLQQSSLQAEEALSQGMEELQHSLSDTISAGSLSAPANMANYMNQMAIAMNKLSNLEIFVRQADSLRLQTLQELNRFLTIRQAAKCFLAIGEYFSRLRALSSLWCARPRE